MQTKTNWDIFWVLGENLYPAKPGQTSMQGWWDWGIFWVLGEKPMVYPPKPKSRWFGMQGCWVWDIFLDFGGKSCTITHTTQKESQQSRIASLLFSYNPNKTRTPAGFKNVRVVEDPASRVSRFGRIHSISYNICFVIRWVYRKLVSSLEWVVI